MRKQYIVLGCVITCIIITFFILCFVRLENKEFPEIDQLNKLGFSEPSLPDAFTLNDGRKVGTSRKLWEERRAEIIEILAQNEYGYIPNTISDGTGDVIETDTKCCSGNAIQEKVMISVETEKGVFSFPISMVLPVVSKKKPVPVFPLLNFRPDVYDMYIPTEEIIDNGFGLAIVYYEDIIEDDPGEVETKDKNNYWDNGVASFFTRPNDGTGFGKISLWAWGASRVMDYLMTREEIDHDHISIIGHSRLGKAALWCGANDDRFYCVISNCSGCAGAALERGHHEGAETISEVLRYESWFCENYSKYCDNQNDMPFDQHFLLALIAPRLLAVGSASEDVWADPENEKIACLLAAPAWRLYGKNGFSEFKQDFDDNDNSYSSINYHKRDGIHYLGRADWLIYMDFIKQSIG